MAAAAAAVDRSAMGLDLEFHLLHGVGFQIRAPWVGPGAPSPWRRLLPLGRPRPSTARRGKIFSQFALPFSSIPLPDALWLPSLLTQSVVVVVTETSRSRLRCLARFQVVGHPPPTLSFCPPLDPICLGGSSA